MLPSADSFPLSCACKLAALRPWSDISADETAREPWQLDLTTAKGRCKDLFVRTSRMLKTLLVERLPYFDGSCPSSLFERSSWGHKFYKREIPDLALWMHSISNAKFELLGMKDRGHDEGPRRDWDMHCRCLEALPSLWLSWWKKVLKKTLTLVCCFMDNCYISHQMCATTMNDLLFDLRRHSAPLMQEFLWCSSMLATNLSGQRPKNFRAHSLLVPYLLNFKGSVWKDMHAAWEATAVVYLICSPFLQLHVCWFHLESANKT